jgi:hypothetical protein
VLFVPGTGVREKAYAAQFALVRSKLAGIGVDPDDVCPCLWGTDHGIRLPDSVLRSQPGRAGAWDDAEALWLLLDTEPLAELEALMEDAPSGADDLGSGGPCGSGDDPGLRSAGVLRTLAVDWPALAGAEPSVLDPDMPGALRTLALVLETRFADTVPDTAAANPALARAVVATALHSADERWGGEAVVAGPERDRLVARVLGRIGGTYGLTADATRLLLRPLMRSTEWAASWHVRRNRSALTDSAVNPLGDILRYQTRGEGLRDFIAEAVEAAKPPVVLLAHSLGGIACVDLLASTELPVELLVTVGSQAPLLYELDALRSLRRSESLPAHFPPWINAYDPRDPLAYVGEPLFGDRISDKEFNTGQPLLRAHSAYWAHDPFYAWLAGALPVADRGTR